jgi:hypothetical protein
MNLLRFSSRESGERIERRPTTLRSGGALGSTPSFIAKAYRACGKESNRPRAGSEWLLRCVKFIIFGFRRTQFTVGLLTVGKF